VTPGWHRRGPEPGGHTLTVVPALNDHAEVEPNSRSITIDQFNGHYAAAPHCP
jgi:hypothetical protein